MQHPVSFWIRYKDDKRTIHHQEETGSRFLSDKMTIKPAMVNGASRKNQ